MSQQEMFGGTGNATSSRGSGCGATRSGALDGPTPEKSGRGVVRASRSLPRGSSEGLQTSGTSGRCGFGSSASVALTLSLVSKLRVRSEADGSTLFKLTWRDAVTPLGRSYYRLAASGVRTSGAGCGSWPTCRGQDSYERRNEKTMERIVREGGDLTLVTAAKMLASWPTPTVVDEAGRGYTYSSGDHAKPALCLPGAAKLASWATPRGEDSECAGAHRGNPDGLHSQAGLASWATPASRDWKDTPGMSDVGTNPDGSERKRVDQLPRQAGLAGRSTASGGPPSGSRAGTGKRGQLNPALSRWLMGLPVEWDEAAIAAHRKMSSTRGKRG